MMNDGRREAERRTATRTRREQRDRVRGLKYLVADLRMQARTRAAANRVARVEPSTPEAFLEWKAADELEKHIINIT